MSYKVLDTGAVLMLGPDPEITVTLTIEAPTTGYTGKLVKSRRVGFNPTILLLDAQIQKPSGAANDVMTKLTLDPYVERGNDKYRHVDVYEILEDDEAVKIEVDVRR